MRIAIFLAILLALSCAAAGQGISLSRQEISRLGEKIFENECGSKEEFLTSWNSGEDFLSLGIGHFIWYPAGRKGPFEESFPKFLDYVRASGERIPDWLNETRYPACPWNSREDFLRSQYDRRLIELRNFLIVTKPLQGEFIVKRLQDALPLILQNTPESNRVRVAKQFHRLASTPQGVYALADYVNFKGLGILSSERYQGKGWGLLQALLEMRHEREAPDAVLEFVRAADKVLTERVNNSPPERGEERWLTGWQRRINSYVKY